MVSERVHVILGLEPGMIYKAQRVARKTRPEPWPITT